VPVEETVRGFREILDGKHDELPEGAFYMKGTIDQVVEEHRGSGNGRPAREAAAEEGEAAAEESGEAEEDRSEEEGSREQVAARVGGGDEGEAASEAGQ
jgi:hypothetical protein